MNDLEDGPKTVGDYIDLLSSFPRDWPVSVKTPAGGGIAVEHREIGGKPVVAIFGKNGGRFGENPLTEEEYAAKSEEFARKIRSPDYLYTSIHGDHRLCFLMRGHQVDTCYGQHYDRRVVERMVKEGMIDAKSVDLDRVSYFERS